MNTLSIVVLVIGVILPLAGIVLSVCLAHKPRNRAIARLAVALPIASLFFGGLLIDRSAVITGHPEWNLDIPSQPMGPMVAFGMFYSLLLMVPALIITCISWDMVGRDPRMHSLER